MVLINPDTDIYKISRNLSYNKCAERERASRPDPDLPLAMFVHDSMHMHMHAPLSAKPN